MSVPVAVQLKPVQHDAARWGDHDNPAHFTFGNDHMAIWLDGCYGGIADGRLKVRTESGTHRYAEKGDWIIKLAPGNFIVVRAAVFDVSYVLVNDNYRFRQTVPAASNG